MAQINPTVGALAANGRLILRAAEAAGGEGAQVVVFPELALSGYPPEDLVLKRHFLDDCREAMEDLARRMPSHLLALVGAPHRDGDRVFNAAFGLHGGRVVAVAYKMLLPNYGVFDEKRLFGEGRRPLAIDFGPLRLGVHICEDSWVAGGRPCRAMAAMRVDAVLNLSASPYHHGKVRQREEVLGAAARAIGAPLLYCNLVGGQDELVFDGASMAVGSDGTVLARARMFEEDLLWLDLTPAPKGRRRTRATVSVTPAATGAGGPAASAPGAPARIEPALEDAAEVYAALRTGLRDYVEKNAFRKTVVALSGGIDSALVAAIAVDALGPERVAGVTMPSRHSSAETRGDAERLAQALGIEFHTLPIEGVFEAFLRDLSRMWTGRPPDITEENLQARIRGVMIMALSNKFGWLVLSTGNKSELATGYCTLYGDMCGGFALIKDVPKTLVWTLSRWRNAQPGGPVIPPSTIDRPPTAELRSHQLDTDSLPPYPVLDAILERYVEQDLSADRIAADGFDPALVRRVIRLVDTSEYKRRQGAPGVKITPKAFGRDRRMPITNQYRERAP